MIGKAKEGVWRLETRLHCSSNGLEDWSCEIYTEHSYHYDANGCAANIAFSPMQTMHQEGVRHIDMCIMVFPLPLQPSSSARAWASAGLC